MTHPALEFLKLLDPSPEARFNIETFPDGKDRQERDRLKRHFSCKSSSEVKALIPTLQSLNGQGAAIYIAVNAFDGPRKLKNLQRVRGIYADLDTASTDQLCKLRKVLTPTISVRSSEGNKQHWYWLLADGEELSPEAAKAINQALVSYGSDKGAVDMARLLRLPGFYNLKHKKDDEAEGCGVPEPPTVAILERGPRYSAAAIQAAFPVAIPQSITPPAPEPASSSTNPAQFTDQIEKAVSFYQTQQPVLWSGRWQDYSDPLTGERPFESQSSADYALCRRIGYRGLENRLSGGELLAFVEAVFSKSGLAKRDKWQSRQDYRDRTVAAACKGLTPLMPMFSSALPTAEPDWSLRGDLIASRFFRDVLGEKMKFVVSVGKWIRWYADAEQWRWCELGEEVEATKQLILELRRLAHIRAANHPDTGVKLTNEITGLQREPRIRAVINLAKSEPGVSLEPQNLDAHPNLLGVRNGVVDLRTGKLGPNRPDLLITKYVDIDYKEDADCDLFRSFLHEVFQNDSDTIDAVHRLAGLTLAGGTSAEVIIFCVGNGANGKSVFGNILTRIMGQYAVTAPSSLLAARRADDHGARSDLAMLRGARLVSINELPSDMTLDETVTKQLAGREPISARFLHKEYFTFDPQFTPWVRTNHRPIIKGTDDGIWRRLVIVPFNRTFSLDKQDHDLEKKLWSEREGILVWLVKGATLYLKSGLKHSRAMQAGIKQYRTDSDLIGEFLVDHTTSAPDAEVKQSDLFMRYQIWCESNALRPSSKRAFTEQLRERGFGQRKSGSIRYYTGVESALVGGGTNGQL